MIAASMSMLFLATACGGDTPGEAAAVTSAGQTSVPTVAPTGQATSDDVDLDQAVADEGPASTPEPDESAEPEGKVLVRASLSNGELTVGTRRVDVSIGSTVVIEVSSDEAEHVHVHGYDLVVAVSPDSPGRLSFVADSAGTFEVELEDSGRFLFDLLVR